MASHIPGRREDLTADLNNPIFQEGEKISQLISQYIDLIIKNKTGGDRRLSETDEEATVIEDQVRPGEALAGDIVFIYFLNRFNFCVLNFEFLFVGNYRYP